MNTNVQPPLGQFEEGLLAELKEFIGAEPAIAPQRSRPPRHRRVLQAAAAVGASAAVAAGLLIATTPRPAPASGYTLDAFLTSAAAAARAEHTPLPRPNQAFYDKNFSQFSWDNAGRCFVQWSLHPLTGVGERLNVISFGDGSRACTNYLGFLPLLVALVDSGRGGFSEVHLYPALNSLPVRPSPLRSALYAAAARGPAYWGLPTSFSAAGMVFTLAGRLLQGPVSGPLRAAAYEVIAGLPGVRIIQHAIDAIGRYGVGIEMRGLPQEQAGAKWTSELIIAPRGYRFLGMSYANGSQHTAYATIASGLVTLPRPAHLNHNGVVYSNPARR